MSSARLKREVECLCKPSFALLSGVDMGPPEEGEHGVTTVHTQEEFRADKQHHTVITALMYQDFIKNMTTNKLQVDVAFIMATADGNATVAIVKNNHKAVEIQGVSSEDDQPLESEASP